MRNTWSILPALALALLVARPAHADDQAEMKALLAKAIKALGGEAKLAKYKATTLKFKGKVYVMGEHEYTAEFAMQNADQFKSTISVDVNGMTFTFITVVNKDKGWIKENDKTKVMDKDRFAEEKQRLYAGSVTSLLVLKKKGFTLSPVGAVKIGQRDATGMKISSKGHRDINLYFDNKTGLLLKMETNVKAMGGDNEVPQETFYEDYKKMDGFMVPTKIRIKRDGKKFVDVTETTEVKYLEKLDDSEFEKP
jgi:hypothetical protein